MPRFRRLFDGRVKPNARVRVERLTSTRDTHGGNVETYATVPGAESVPCLVGEIVASRPGNHQGRRVHLSGSLHGEHPALGMDGTRFYFLGVEDPGAPVHEVTGRYAVADTVGPSGPGVRLIPYRWYSVQWTTLGAGTADATGAEAG